MTIGYQLPLIEQTHHHKKKVQGHMAKTSKTKMNINVIVQLYEKKMNKNITKKM